MRKIFFIGIILLTGIVFSCDYFFPAPLGRDNPQDEDVQIKNFSSLVSGKESINTIWEWSEPSSAVEDSQIIDKIRIVHKENDRPTSMYPLDKDSVTEITAKTTWNYTWENLKQDREHCFALYAHEKGGTWLAPIHVSVHLDSYPQEHTLTLLSSDLIAPDDSEEFDVLKVESPSFTKTNVSNDNAYTWNSGDFLVLIFKGDQQFFFDQFTLYLQNSVPGSDVMLSIYALKKEFESVVDSADMSSDATLDTGSVIYREVPISGGTNQQIEISEVINKMVLYRSRSIAISIDNPLDMNFQNWTIDTHFWGYY